jgi:hypothetical protein
MPILIIPVIAIVTFLHIVAAFVYFAIALGILEAFQSANFGYAFGQRVGFSASVIGAVTGAMLALEKYWNQLKWHDGSIAWVSRVLALCACAFIIGVPLSNSGMEMLSSLVHYGKFGFLAVLPFYAGARFQMDLPD